VGLPRCVLSNFLALERRPYGRHVLAELAAEGNAILTSLIMFFLATLPCSWAAAVSHRDLHGELSELNINMTLPIQRIVWSPANWSDAGTTRYSA
jgi:hypothetical protein